MKYKKILIAGISGSGKSTLAKLISEKYNIPIVCRDDYMLQMGIRDKNKLKEEVLKACVGTEWILEGMLMYGSEEFINQGDLLIFIDINYIRNLRNIIRRKLEHIFTHSKVVIKFRNRGIHLKNFELITRNRRKYINDWKDILSKHNNSIKIIKIKKVSAKSFLKITDEIDNNIA